jgi:hypothetical protein
MGIHRGSNIIRSGLAFAYDTGYSSTFGNSSNYLYNKGKPTTNLLGTTGDMLPSNPETPYDLTTSSSTSNVNGTTWDLSLYNSTSLATNNGVAWHPNIEGPGFKGAWRLKKRPGSNWETQFSNGVGAVSNTTAIVLSVWCKTTVSGVARINANTTRNGSSNWGNSSAYHSGSGKWERLSYVIPAGSGVTSINVIRCQVGGTTLTTDVYWRRFQVEYGTTPTPFTTGTRSATNSLLDITKQYDINVSNASFDSDAHIDLDGTGDYLSLGSDITFKTNGGSGGWTVESVVKYDSVAGGYNNSTSPANFIGSSGISYNSWYWSVLNSKLALWNISPGVWKYGSTTLAADTWYHTVLTCFGDGSSYQMYLNGNAEGGDHVSYSWNTSYSGLKVQYFGAGDTSRRYVNGKLPITRIYNRALSAVEVKQNFNAYKDRFNM